MMEENSVCACLDYSAAREYGLRLDGAEEVGPRRMSGIGR